MNAAWDIQQLLGDGRSHETWLGNDLENAAVGFDDKIL